jgi:hypothetical protein
MPISFIKKITISPKNHTFKIIQKAKICKITYLEEPHVLDADFLHSLSYGKLRQIFGCGWQIVEPGPGVISPDSVEARRDNDIRLLKLVGSIVGRISQACADTVSSAACTCMSWLCSSQPPWQHLVLQMQTASSVGDTVFSMI